MGTRVKYIITDDFSTFYDSREAADKAYEMKLLSLPENEREAYKFMYHVAPYLCNN